MKIITKFALLAFLLLLVESVSATVFTTDLYKFQFDGITASSYPSTPSISATLYTGTTTSTSLFGTLSGSVALNGGANLLFSGGGGGGRGAVAYNFNNNTALPTNKKVVLEFDWNPNTTNADAMAYNALGISDASKNPIFILVSEIWSGTNSGVHLMNLAPSTVATSWFLNSATYATTGDYKADCVTAFAGSRLDASSPYNFPNNKTYRVKAKLDFSTHMIDSITITRSDDALLKYVGTNIAFLSAAANNVDRISAVATRGKNQTNSGNGGNSHLWMTLDNYSVYTWEDVPTAAVTVKYYDATNNALVTTVTRSGVVGGTYSISSDDKKSFTFGGNYCVFSSIISDNVTVAGDGSSYVRLKVKRYPVTSGTYSWVGGVDMNWNELTANFTTDGSNSLGYQPGNAVTFGSAGVSKIVSMNDLVNLGTGDMTINDGGYDINGTGTIIGSGKMAINMAAGQLVKINLNNNLSGGTEISGGSVNMIKTGALGSSLLIKGASTLIPTTGAAFPPTTFNASAELACDTFYTSINGMTAGAGTKIAIASQYNTSATGIPAFTFAASGTLSAGAELELTGYGTENKFGMTAASTTYLANAKVTLKGNSFLYIESNQGAATTINVGTLAGESTAKLGWGRSSDLNRTITWSVGALNENSDFAGTITNIGGYASSGSFYTGNFTHFIKEGTGIQTLSGTANTHNGNFTVNNGKLNVTGNICKSTSTVTVGANGTLTGTGTIGGATTVNGILEGRLNFGSSLTLAGTTKIVVNGFEAGQYDVVNVAGALTYGGTLEITVNGPNPAIGTSIKIMNFASKTGDFAQPVTAPVNYSYNKETGMLTYDGTTDIDKAGIANLRIYPTVTNGIIRVEGNVSRIEVLNTLGQVLKNEVLNSTANSVNLSQLSAGTYLVKAYAPDGNNATRRIIISR